MNSQMLCWCGKPVKKSEPESASVETVFRCMDGHRLVRQMGLKHRQD